MFFRHIVSIWHVWFRCVLLLLAPCICMPIQRRYLISPLTPFRYRR
jgi:hypothetical protein